MKASAIPLQVNRSNLSMTAPARSKDLLGLIHEMDRSAATSGNLFAAHMLYRGAHGETTILPKYYFAGGGTDVSFLRIGIFAGLHGDEEAGILATLELLQLLAKRPELASGYEIFAYPICNPTGYELGRRESVSGADLNREFWKNSSEPEVMLLERQLSNLAFDGIIALHSDDTSSGLYGFVQGPALSRYVLEPALTRAEAFLPRNFDRQIDSFFAQRGIIEEGYQGVLAAPIEQKPQPFQIVFETPAEAPLSLQVDATLAAIQEIFDRYRVLISEGQNI